VVLKKVLLHVREGSLCLSVMLHVESLAVRGGGAPSWVNVAIDTLVALTPGSLDSV